MRARRSLSQKSTTMPFTRSSARIQKTTHEGSGYSAERPEKHSWLKQATNIQSQQSGVCAFVRLPNEIIETIAADLDMPSFGKLRLACKEMESKTLWYFTKKYFREMKFMHSKYALEALVAMSHSRMAQYVRRLGLGPPSNDQGPFIFASGPSISPTAKKQITSAMFDYAEENRTMRAFGEDAVLIERALRNLQGLKDIEFLDASECACPFCSIKSSYGERHLIDRVGEGEVVFHPIHLDASQSVARLLHITLSAVQSTGLQLECVDAHISHHPDVDECMSTGFGSYPLTFPSAPPRGTVAGPSFASLSTLKLFIGHHEEICVTERRERLIHRITSFVDQAPTLRTIGLTFRQDLHQTELFLLSLLSSPSLQKIKQLEFGNLSIELDDLTCSLNHVRKTLQALKLRFFWVLAEDGIDMLKWLRDEMTALEEVEFEAFRGECCSVSYKGDSISDFFNETIVDWKNDMLTDMEDSDAISDDLDDTGSESL